MLEQQKYISAQVFSTIYTMGQLDLIETVFHPEYVQKPIGYTGFEGIKRHVNEFRAAFSDLSFELIDQIGENDGVVNLILVTGTHTGPLWEHIEPTNRQVMVMTMIVHRFIDGKIVEGLVSMDQLGMLQQLGVIPRPVWRKPA